MDDELSKLKREGELDPEAIANKEAYERAKRRELPKRELLDDITMLFEPDFDAYFVTVLGLALGDPVSKIPKDLVIACVEQGQFEPVFRKDVDLATFNTSYEKSTLSRGSVFLPYHSDEVVPELIRFDSVDSQISQVTLCESALTALEIQSENAIHEKWGRIDNYSRSYSKTTYLPPSQMFTVIWQNKYNKIDSVKLGKDPSSEVTRFSAQDLIQLSFDWSPEERGFDNPVENNFGTEVIRAQRLKALFHAFELLDIGIESVSDLFRGSRIIAESWIDRYQELWAILEAEGLADPSHCSPLDEFGARDVRFLWQRLVEFQRLLNATVEYGASVAMAGGFYRIVHNHTRASSKKVKDDRNRNNKILSLILDPEQRVFTWGELVRNHEFPDDDLDELEYELFC